MTIIKQQKFKKIIITMIIIEYLTAGCYLYNCSHFILFINHNHIGTLQKHSLCRFAKDEIVSKNNFELLHYLCVEVLKTLKTFSENNDISKVYAAVLVKLSDFIR